MGRLGGLWVAHGWGHSLGCVRTKRAKEPQTCSGSLAPWPGHGLAAHGGPKILLGGPRVPYSPLSTFFRPMAQAEGLGPNVRPFGAPPVWGPSQAPYEPTCGRCGIHGSPSCMLVWHQSLRPRHGGPRYVRLSPPP